MSLFVRHSAWLNALQDRGAKSKEPRQSRLERMRAERKDADYVPDMPPVEAEYLLAILFEIGPTMAAGMGAGPITHEELRAWQENTGIELQPWQVRTLRRLSCDYLVESNKAEKADCPAPWQPVGAVVDRAAVSNSMRDAIRAMAGDLT